MNIFFLLLLPALAWPSGTSYKLNDKHYYLAFEKGITASPRCFTESSCEAIKEAKKLKGTTLPITQNGKNPFAVLCKENLKAEMVMGVGTKGEEESFCRFKDDSIISCGSLNEFRD